MGAALVVARYVFAEAVRRRTFTVVGVITAALVGLYAWGAWVAFDAAGEVIQLRNLLVDGTVFVGNQLSGVAIFAQLFLGAVLAVLLSQSAIRGDAEQGLLQPIVARPVGRTAYLLVRCLVVAVFCALFVVAAYAAISVITGLVGDYWPRQPIMPAVYLALAIVVITALTVASSVVLGMTANGIAVFLIFGAGLANGMLVGIGETTGAQGLQDAASIIAWALPFEPLYQAAVHASAQQADGLVASVIQAGPFSGGREPSPWLVPWALTYVAATLTVAATVFSRRDL